MSRLARLRISGKKKTLCSGQGAPGHRLGLIIGLSLSTIRHKLLLSKAVSVQHFFTVKDAFLKSNWNFRMLELELECYRQINIVF